MVVVPWKNILSLFGEMLLNLVKLLAVISPHIHKLLSHWFNEILNVIVLLLEWLHVLIIFDSKLLHKALDEFFLLLDNSLTSLFLDLNILCKLFAILLFLQLLPSPVNLHIFLVGRDDFSLDAVWSLLFSDLFFDATLIFERVRMRPNLRNYVRGFTLQLFQESYTQNKVNKSNGMIVKSVKTNR